MVLWSVKDMSMKEEEDRLATIKVAEFITEGGII